MTGSPGPARAGPRGTAFGALAIFLPLCALLTWWGYTQRDVAAGVPGWQPPAAALVIASILAAGGPALLLALVVDNHARLRVVFRPRGGKTLTAVGLALITPMAVVNFWPWLSGPLAVTMLLLSIEETGQLHPDLAAMVPAGLAVFVIFSLGWYGVGALLISGIRRRPLRFAGFVLCWWAIYGGVLLFAGYRG